jgi:hypothetical protein
VSQVEDLQWPTKARRGKDPTAAEQSIVATTGYTLQCPPQFALIEWTVTTPMWTALQLKAFDDQVVRFLAYAPNRTDKAMQIGDTGNLKLISGIWYRGANPTTIRIFGALRYSTSADKWTMPVTMRCVAAPLFICSAGLRASITPAPNQRFTIWSDSDGYGDVHITSPSGLLQHERDVPGTPPSRDPSRCR